MRNSTEAIRSFAVHQHPNTRYDDEAKAAPQRPSLSDRFNHSERLSGRTRQIKKDTFSSSLISILSPRDFKAPLAGHNEQTGNVFSTGTPVRRGTFF
jgi:hypothetical protein